MAKMKVLMLFGLMFKISLFTLVSCSLLLSILMLKDTSAKVEIVRGDHREVYSDYEESNEIGTAYPKEKNLNYMESTIISQKETPNRQTREERITTTQMPQIVNVRDIVDHCKNASILKCEIKEVSDFNAYFQVENEGIIYSCLTDSIDGLSSCEGNDKLPRDFPKMPVIPITRLDNKRHFSVGTKFYIIESLAKESYPISYNGLPTNGTISLQTVKLSGDCKFSKSNFANPYTVILTSPERIMGFILKKSGEEVSSKIQSFSGKATLTFAEKDMDREHNLLCGDKSAQVPKTDKRVRDCIIKYSKNIYKQTACINFSWIRLVIIALIVYFPISWLVNKTMKSLFLWYDVLGLITYPVLLLINYLWRYFPFKCKNCGNICIVTHECAKKCVCNKTKASMEHCEDCLLLSKDKKFEMPSENKKWTSIEWFHFIVNTRISLTILKLVTELMIGMVILSQMPMTMAQTTRCLSNCYYVPGCDKLVVDKFDKCPSKDQCYCNIQPNKIVESVIGTNIVVEGPNDCIKDQTCSSSTTLQDLLKCKMGCEYMDLVINKPLKNGFMEYTGDTMGLTAVNLHYMKRLRNGIIDSYKVTERMSSLIAGDSLLQNDTVIPENMLPRKSLIFDSIVDGKYRYMIEISLLKGGGSVYSLNDKSSMSPQKFVVYVKNVGIHYDVSERYTTAPILSTHTDYYSTCTGDCSSCQKEQKITGFQDFCITPTSYWGCEEAWCFAINEGATCGFCRNVYDMDKSFRVYSVIRSTIRASVCFSGVVGTKCITVTDESPVESGMFQADLIPDLHNDGITIGGLIAHGSDSHIYSGNIANLNDPVKMFGHPQLSHEGDPIFTKKTLDGEDLSWDCAAIGRKSVTIKSCGYDTYRFKSGLDQISDIPVIFKDFNSFFLEKSYNLGKLRVVVDLPSELFKVAAKQPSITSTQITCSGCLLCAQGLYCGLSFFSDMTFSTSLNLDSCSLSTNQLAVKKGSNKYNITLFCSSNPDKQKITFFPEGNKDLVFTININSVNIMEPGNIIDQNDEYAHEEQQYNSDTSAWTFWDYLKSPFNFIASYFGTFFDTIRVVLLIAFIFVLVYFLSMLYTICRDYIRTKSYKSKAKNDYDESADNEEESTTMVKKDRLTRRRPPLDFV